MDSKYAIIYKPAGGTSDIQAIRELYDPTANLVGPHVTLVFPFSPEELSEPELAAHVESISKATEPFRSHFTGVELSWDQWLFLTPDVGGENFIDLHDRLYADPLRDFLHADIPFIPHFSIGYMGIQTDHLDPTKPAEGKLDRLRYEGASAILEKVDLTSEFWVNQIQLVRLEVTSSDLKIVRSYSLGDLRDPLSIVSNAR